MAELPEGRLAAVDLRDASCLEGLMSLHFKSFAKTCPAPRLFPSDLALVSSCDVGTPA